MTLALAVMAKLYITYESVFTFCFQELKSILNVFNLKVDIPEQDVRVSISLLSNTLRYICSTITGALFINEFYKQFLTQGVGGGVKFKKFHPCDLIGQTEISISRSK